MTDQHVRCMAGLGYQEAEISAERWSSTRRLLGETTQRGSQGWHGCMSMERECGAGRANTTLALQLYWQAVEGAPGASYAAAPFLLYIWLRFQLLAATIPGLKPQGDIVTDLINVLTLTLSLLLVVWLRRSRVWLGLRQRP